MKQRKCVFAGTFDPPTVGHEEVVHTALTMFDQVVVAVMVNPQKKSALTVEQRVALLKQLFGGNPAVEVISFYGAAVDLLKEQNTEFYVRGVRDGIDFEYENRNFYASKKLDGDMVTIYLPCSQETMHISSTLVRNSVRFGKPIEGLVPQKILNEVYTLLEKQDV